jgi:hypothetical protein
MKTSEETFRLRVHEDANRVRVRDELEHRLEARLSNKKRIGMSLLTAATALVLAALLAGAGTIAVSSRHSAQRAASGATAAPPRPTGVYRSIPLPDDLHVTPPDESLPASLRNFSGVWQGTGDAHLPLVFVVEEVNAKTVEAVYAWATNGVITRPGWSRLTANVQSPNKIVWSRVVPAANARYVCGPVSGACTLRFIYTISADGKSLSGRRQEQFSTGGVENDVTMHHPNGSSSSSASSSSSRTPLWIAIAIVGAAILASGGFWLGRVRSRRVGQ